MTSLQAALLYHGKTTLNYATFEAARVGAVTNAQSQAMRKELGFRLAAVESGDGSSEKALDAIGVSLVNAGDIVSTQLIILNPTMAAFEDWGVLDKAGVRRVIPNAHLQHKSTEIGPVSGVSLQDANLLKVEVTYGMNMKVPVVAELVASAMRLVDPSNAHFYQRKQFPLTSHATVRMQSPAWEDEIRQANEPVVVPDIDPVRNELDNEPTTPTDTEPTSNQLPTDCDGGEFGLGGISELIDTTDYENQQCPTHDPAYTALLPTSSLTNNGVTGDCV